MNTTETNRLERRASQRFELHLPVAVHHDGKTISGFTQDLSGRGIFFFSEAALTPGAAVELTFLMPSVITLGPSMPVRCRGKVVRAASAHSGHSHGLAAAFDTYEYLPAGEPDQAAQIARVAAAAATGHSLHR